MASATLRATAARRRSSADAATVSAVLLVIVGTLGVAREARRSTFTGDDWSFILDRRGFSAHVLLAPHNEHLSALPILVYKALLAVFGAGSYAPFMAALLTVHATVCLLLFALARRHVGRWVALVPVAIMVVLGPAWQDLLWAFQIGYLGSAAGGLGMALCLERRGRYGDLGAAVLLGVSILCSSVGLAMIPFAVVLIALQRPTSARRFWAVGTPTGLYLLWYAFYGVSTEKASNIPKIPHYVFDAAAAGLASITGVGQTHVSPYLVSTSWGRFLLPVALVLLAVRIVRGRRVIPMTWAAGAAAIALWIAEAIEYFPGGREAAQSRYQYTAAVLILLVGLSAADGLRLGRRAGALLAAATVAVMGANYDILHSRIAFWSLTGAYDRTEEGALEIGRGIVAPSFAPDNAIIAALVGVQNVSVVTAGPYLSAARAFGSNAYTPTDILREPDDVRAAADVVLILGERILPMPADGVGVAACRPVPREITGPVTLLVRGGPSSPAHLELRRLAAAYRFPPFTISRGTSATLRIPADRSSVPWRAHLTGAGARLCAG